ncbi:hypothetical protein HanRHA438_Chr04g0166591 [Helianthus annuus]|nr:hypothetical protein HanRHA438_Chr04g0166591 [Helianthus annuus]
MYLYSRLWWLFFHQSLPRIMLLLSLDATFVSLYTFIILVNNKHIQSKRKKERGFDRERWGSDCFPGSPPFHNMMLRARETGETKYGVNMRICKKS